MAQPDRFRDYVATMTDSITSSSMDVGIARGWNVWPLSNGDWAWTAWAAENLGLPRSGVEATEAKAQEAARRELELIISQARPAAQARRRLAVRHEGPPS